MKKKILFFVPIIIVLIIVVSCIVYLNSDSKKTKDREVLLKDMASTYYEKYYYDTVGVDNIKRYSEKGIVVDLDTLYNSKLFKNEKKLKKCDKNKTLVKIKPNKPFNKDDKTIEVELSCE